MHTPFELVEMEVRPVLSVRTVSAVGALPATLGDIYPRLMQYLSELGEAPAGAPFVGYYNMDMEHLDIEVGFPVRHQLPGREDIHPGEIPAGTYVQCLHTGSYQAMESTYASLMEWMDKQHHETTGTVYEFYLNSPESVPESQLKTLILFHVS